MSDHPSSEWDIPNPAALWNVETGAIVAGADKLDVLTDDGRINAAAMLRNQVGLHARDLNDEWLLALATFMVDDLCKSYYNQFRWTEGVHAYVVATADVVLEELSRRDFGTPLRF